jgi:competence protein ComEA
MANTWKNRVLIAISALLVIFIIAAGTIVWLRYPASHPVEIIMPPAAGFTGEVSVNGAITRPGIYPIREGDTLSTIIEAAGGRTADADGSRLEINIPCTGEGNQPQKVNINSAGLWLLETLPGIGVYKAQAIIDYRNSNGPFHSTDELTRVAGIGDATYQKIKELITASD